MSRKGRKTLASWLFVYVGLIVATIIVAKTGSAASRDEVNLSPVAIGGEPPTLAVESVVRRSDI